MNSQSRRICLIQSSPHWGAIEEYLALIANGLTPRGWTVGVIYPEGDELQSMVNLFQPAIEQIPLPIHAFSSIRYVREIQRSLNQFQPDIVHCNDPGLVAMLATLLSKTPCRVLTFHTPSQSFNYRFHAKFLHRWLLRQGWQIVVIAPVNQPTLQQHYQIPKSNIHVIEYGLSPQKFQIPDTRAQIRSEFAIAPDCILLGCVGRLAVQKNHALLLNAYAELPKALRTNSHLLLVGDGDLRSVLQQQVAQLGLANYVTFAGYRQDIPQLLQAMDGFVLASNYEGLPFAILEAMAMGLPVVATAVDGVRDAVIPGKTGWLVPPGQIAPLQTAIADLIADPVQRQQHGQAGRDRFESHYTDRRMVNDIETLYCNLTGVTANGCPAEHLH
jgi:glycosyltransferase involved in cell wall biosynthesis